MSNVIAFFHANWPWLGPLLVVLVSSLVTALTKYPKAETWLHVALDVLSFLTHKDSPGTMKLPLLSRSKNPNVSSPSKPAAVGGAAASIAILVGVGAFMGSMPSCGQNSQNVLPTIVKTGQDIDRVCGSPAIAPAVASLLTPVAAVLQGGAVAQGVDWWSQLNALATLGVATVCAVRVVVEDLGTKAKTLATAALDKAAMTINPFQESADRGQSWLNDVRPPSLK